MSNSERFLLSLLSFLFSQTVPILSAQSAVQFYQFKQITPPPDRVKLQHIFTAFDTTRWGCLLVAKHTSDQVCFRHISLYVTSPKSLLFCYFVTFAQKLTGLKVGYKSQNRCPPDIVRPVTKSPKMPRFTAFCRIFLFSCFYARILHYFQNGAK